MLTALMIQAIGQIGLFASRAFVPAFAAAVLMRFGPQMPWINAQQLLGVTGFSTAPSWFTSDPCLLILGLLALAEIGANKNADLRQLLATVDQYLKPALAAITFLGIADAADTSFIQQNLDPVTQLPVVLPVVVMSAGVSMAGLLSGFVAAGTFLVASVRGVLVGVMADVDEDDDTGVQKLLSWAEDLYAFVGLWFLILFPVVMIALIALVSGLLFLLRWYAVQREEKAKVPCTSCGEEMYRCAVTCGGCKLDNAESCRVGLLGQTVSDQPADSTTQPFRLVEAKRCPVCATRLTEHQPRQTCPHCGHELFAEADFVTGYDKRIAARLPFVLPVCVGLSLIPIIGLIPGVIYYRMALVAPFRRYVPWGRNVLAKWSIRLLFIVLIAIQWVPVLGAVTVPAMALLSYITYRSLFLGQLREER